MIAGGGPQGSPLALHSLAGQPHPEALFPFLRLARFLALLPEADVLLSRQPLALKAKPLLKRADAASESAASMKAVEDSFRLVSRNRPPSAAIRAIVTAPASQTCANHFQQ
jgi:hypothetical protein